MAGATGSATLTFHAIGDSVSEVAVTGQAGLTTAGKAEAWFMGVATASNTIDDHALAASFCHPVCIITGDGEFTIRAVSLEPLSGEYTIQWVWNE